MPEPFFASRACVASKYGTEKSRPCLRSSVIVMPAAATSHLPALRSAPVLIVSKGVSTTSCSTPSSSATMSISSTSKPTTSPSRSNWNGG